MSREMTSMGRRDSSFFIIAIIAFVALWLPALFTLEASSFPSWAVHWGLDLHRKWVIRGDYLIIPPLSVFVLWKLFKSKPSQTEWGFSMASFVPAIKYLLLPTVMGAGIIILISLISHRFFETHFWSNPVFWRRALNPLNALAQQAVIQLYFHRQCIPWFGKEKKTCWMITLYFVLLHLPNPGLMLGTAFGMYFWSRCYQLFPNLWVIACSHSILSALWMSTAPHALLPSLSVGLRFVEKGISQGWWYFQ